MKEPQCQLLHLWFLLLCYVFLWKSVLLRVAIDHSLSVQVVFHCKYITMYLSILLLMTLWVDSRWRLFWIGFLWTFLCMPFDSCKYIFCHINCLLKHNAIVKKSSGFFCFVLFFFLVEVGWGMEVVGINGDSPEWKLGTYLWVEFFAHSRWTSLAFLSTAKQFSKIRSLVLKRQGY